MECQFPIHQRHVHVHHVLCESNIEGLPHVLASNIDSFWQVVEGSISQIPRLLRTNSSVFAGNIVLYSIY